MTCIVSGRDRVRILAAIIVLPLSACGIASQVDARNEYQKSTDNYKQCLVANPGGPQQCEALRLAMEADGRKYHDASPVLLDKIKPGAPPPDFAGSQ